MISGKAKIAGVMGWPIGHSRSPRLHGYWLNKYKVDGAYIPMAVEPSEIEKALRTLPVLGFMGCNLTIPHKETALKIVDQVDTLAKRTGAVNTIIIQKDGCLEGRNTDVFGFQENLKSAGFEKSKENNVATILGAGGAARAVVVALQEMGFDEIRIVNRSKDRAEAMAENLQNNNKMRVFAWDETRQALDGSRLLINTTTLGMQGQPDLDIDLSPLPSSAWVTDIVYTPLMTNLLKQAQHRNLRFVDGLGMLLHQARPGFAAWFGREPEVSDDLRQYVLQDD